MISGRAAYAVLAAFLMAVVLLLAAPAWSQDKKDPDRAGDAARKGLERERGQASERTGETTADEDSKRARSGASRKDSDRSRDVTAEESSKRDRSRASSNDRKAESRASGGDSLKQAEVEVNDDGDNVVDETDVITIRGNYRVSSDATVTLKDRDGTRGKFIDRGSAADNADIVEGSVKITVTGPPKIEANGNDSGELDIKGLVVADSTGIGANRFGRRGGRDACRQNINIGELQYRPIEQICIVEGGGIDGRRPFPPFFDEEFDFFEDFEEELAELLEEDDEEVVVRVEPDGVVADTSAVGKLPFTGGPSFTGVVAVIAALALLGAGAGVVLLRLGRGRSDD